MTTPRAQAWRWYAGHLKAQRRGLALVVAVSAAMVLATLPVLWLVRHALDVAIPQGLTAEILWVGAAILLCRAATAAAMVAVAAPAARRTRLVTAAMRADLVAGLHRMRWQDRAALEGARAHGRIVHETERVEQMSQGLFQWALPAVLPIAAYVTVLALLSWRLTLILLALTPLLRLVSWWTARRLRRAIGGYQGEFEEFHLDTQRTLQMLPVTTVQGSAAGMLAAYRDRVATLAAAGTRMAAAGVANVQAGASAASIVAVVTLVAGGIAVADGQMTTGALAAFFVAANQVNSSLGTLIGGVPLLLSGDAALLRLQELRGIGVDADAGGSATPDFAAPMVLDRVGFGYPGRRLFDGVSLVVAPGQLVALAAVNGEGKTSLLELMLGLHRPDVGTIRLGDHDLADLDLGRFRAGCGVLPQHPLFFPGTVRENILFGRAGIDDAALDRAVYSAALQPVLDTLPDGLDAPMGDGGQLLSGGERQRVALARALVHDPALLILDEPSNHLDADALALIVERLLAAPDRPTCLIATHDPRLLALADSVHDLGGGKLTQRPRLQLAAAR